MVPRSPNPPRELALIEAARGGDQDAYRRLVEGRQGELHAHCYRMLGSVHDADSALEEAPLTPESRYEQRESVELAFVAALQHLPSNQRAALVLRDVLGFSAQEAADALETSVPSLNSALQRARRTIAERGPERSQQETLRALGDQATREVVAEYADAMQRGDVDVVVSLLTQDATWSMPPLPCWFAGRDGIGGFLSRYAFSVDWRHLPAHANGQLAVGCYARDPASGVYTASVLDVLTLEGRRVRAVTAFATPEVFRRLGRKDGPFVVSGLFARFGLPERLPGR